jgi:hypothetical protein
MSINLFIENKTVKKKDYMGWRAGTTTLYAGLNYIPQ